jgi:plasmid stability protein
MATLYVENVPKELYEALRERARERRRSMAAEVVALLEESVPTEKELKARRELLGRLERMRANEPVGSDVNRMGIHNPLGRRRGKKRRDRSQFPATEEMQREDRER